MHTVKKISVDGFWGNKSVSVDFDKNINFLIGRNGSGKTTLINMLASTLRLDLEALERLAFKQITLELGSVGSRSTAELQVIRGSNQPNTASAISIRFRDKKSDPWFEEDFSAWLENRRRMRVNHFMRVAPREVTNLASRLQQAVNLTWLSIHRSTLGRRFEGQEGNESTVDAKVNEISTNLGSFLSSLDNLAARENSSFEEHIFLALLFDPENNYSVRNRLRDLDVIQEKDVLTKIFRRFGLTERNFRSKLDAHFNAVSGALKNPNNGPIDVRDFIAITDAQRIRKVVGEWQNSQDRISAIYKPKDTFIKSINDLFIHKSLAIDDRDRPYIITDDKKRFGPEALSSGEKQLYILLGEVLLQEEQPFIFIADEPELSLHVEWQSTLVNNLISLNPNMQIIFATHSPDIVSIYQKSVIKMERKIK